MKKKLIFSISILIPLIIIGLLSARYRSNIVENEGRELFGDFNKKYGLDSQENGLLLACKTGSPEIKTKNHISYWIKNSEFKGYFLIKNLYNANKVFHVKFLRNYSAINISYDNNSEKDIYTWRADPRGEKIINFSLRDIPLGAHDIMILVLEEENKKISKIFSLHRTIFRGQDKFESRDYLKPEFSKKQITSWLTNDKNQTNIYIEKDYLKGIKNFVIISFNGINQCKFSDDVLVKYYSIPAVNNTGSFRIVDKQGAVVSESRDIYYILITNPYQPVESPIGVINPHNTKMCLMIREHNRSVYE